MKKFVFFVKMDKMPLVCNLMPFADSDLNCIFSKEIENKKNKFIFDQIQISANLISHWRERNLLINNFYSQNNYRAPYFRK